MATAMLDGTVLDQFRKTLKGELLTPAEAGYDEARRLFNRLIDRRPAAIVRCADADDVAAAIDLARKTGIEVSVRGGGHGVTGAALVENGLTIDLSAMKIIEVDPKAGIARAGAGVTWGEFDAATQAHGLAVTGGRVSSTGISGLTLGIGSGWLERVFGFSCDNLLSAEVVTADGRILKASETENSDLFWGLRGGGGNFGVVTRFDFRLHPVGPMVLAGLVIHAAEDAPATLRAYRDIMATAPDAVGGAFAFLTAPPAPFIPEPARGKRVTALILLHVGPLADGEHALAPLRTIGRPLIDMVQPMPYTAFQQLIDAGNPPGRNQYWRADLLDRLSDAAIDVISDQASRVTSPHTAVLLEPLGGALSRVPEAATPIRRRDAAYAYHALSTWTDDDHDRHIAWTRALSKAMQPYATEGVYLTYIGDEGDERVRQAYGPEKFARLVALKDRYDPTNMFHLNQNIRPSGKAPAG